MKILLATGMYPPDIGGPATYAKLLAEALPRQGIQVDILFFGSVRRLPPLVRHLVFALKAIWHARASDIVFAQDTVSVGLPALAAALVLGKPFLLRVPGDYAWEQGSQRYGVTDSVDDFQKKRYGFRVELLRRIQKLVAEQADRVMAPSRYFADLVKGWVSDPGKVSAVYNGVDLSLAAAAGLGVSFAPKTIISAGRLVPWKGFDSLIRMMKRLPEWRLEIVGDGPDMQKLQALVREEKLDGRVSLVGRLDRAELLRRVAASEVFALNTSFESFSYQIVEAMAVGTPVVAARAGNLAEIIDDGVDGRLVPLGNDQEFVSTIQQISRDPSTRARLSEAGKKKAAHFSIEATVSSVSTIAAEIHGHESPARDRKAFLAKIFRYLFSGGTAAVTDLVLLYIFTDVFGMWYLLSSIVAFLFAFVVSFVLQKFFTFQDHGLDGVHGQAAAYLAVTGTNLAVNTGLIYLFVQYTGLHYLAAQIVTSVIVAIESFVIYGMFIFKKKKAPKTSRTI